MASSPEAIAERALAGAPVGRGAPFGNTNFKKGHMYRQALERALAGKPDALAAIALKAIEDAVKGDAKAREHVVERLDGKVDQPITGAGGGPIQIQAVVITDAMMAKLTAEQLDAFERAIPALEVLGLASFVPAGAGEAGGAEEA